MGLGGGAGSVLPPADTFLVLVATKAGAFGGSCPGALPLAVGGGIAHPSPCFQDGRPGTASGPVEALLFQAGEGRPNSSPGWSRVHTPCPRCDPVWTSCPARAACSGAFQPLTRRAPGPSLSNR